MPGSITYTPKRRTIERPDDLTLSAVGFSLGRRFEGRISSDIRQPRAASNAAVDSFKAASRGRYSQNIGHKEAHLEPILSCVTRTSAHIGQPVYEQRYRSVACRVSFDADRAPHGRWFTETNKTAPIRPRCSSVSLRAQASVFPWSTRLSASSACPSIPCRFAAGTVVDRPHSRIAQISAKATLPEAGGSRIGARRSNRVPAGWRGPDYGPVACSKARESASARSVIAVGDGCPLCATGHRSRRNIYALDSFGGRDTSHNE